MSTQPTPKQWFNRDEAAEYLGCSVATVDRLGRVGTLTKHRLGGGNRRKIVFYVDQLDALREPIPAGEAS